MNRRNFVTLASLAPFLAQAKDLYASSPGKPLVALPQNATVYDSGHGETSILVDSAQSGGAWWLGVQAFDPGRKTSLHVHYSAEEQFYVLDGTLSVWLNEHWIDLPEGGLAVATHKTPHALANRTAKPLRFLLAGQPGGFERYFADLQVLTRRMSYGTPEFFAELAKVYLKYDSKLLGPPPAG